MYSSVISPQQSSRLSQINTPGFSSAHLGQFSARVFKAPTIGSYYPAPPKYDPAFRSTSAAPTSDYYSSSSKRYEDAPPPSRFPSSSDPQRSSHYPPPPPPAIRTTNLNAREYPSRPPTHQSNYTITRAGNADDTYIYERSDRFSQSEYDDTATNRSYSPSDDTISPVSTTSIDSTMAIKSPAPSPLTERDERDREGGSGTAATRRNSISGVVPNPGTGIGLGVGGVGSATGRNYPSPSSNHEGGSPLRSEGHVVGTPGSTSTPPPILIPPSTSDSRTQSSSTSASYATAPSSLPPPSSLAPVPIPPSGGYTWHHAIPTIPPSVAESEDVSLEARMNAEYNAIATGPLYTSRDTDTDSTDTVRGPIHPITSANRDSPPNNGRQDGTRLHVTIPGAHSDGPTGGPNAIREPVARSPASSMVVESLEEGRGAGFIKNRNSTVVVGDHEQFLPPFADDRWVNDQEARLERERSGVDSVSYQRVAIPPPAPELRREYSSSRSLVSSTNATYATSSPPPRATVVQFPAVGEISSTPAAPPPVTAPAMTPRSRRDSRAGHSAPPPPPPPRAEPTRRPSTAARDAPPTSSRSSPCQAEPKLDASPRRRTESALGLHLPESATTTPPSSSSRAVGSGYAPPPASRPEPYSSSSSKSDRRGSPPNFLAGEMLRPQSTTPESSYRSTTRTTTSTQYRSQSNSPPEKHCTPTTNADSYRDVPHRSQSTAPQSGHVYRTAADGSSSEVYRSQSTVPQESIPSSHRSKKPSYPPPQPIPTGNLPAPGTSSYLNGQLPPSRTRTNSGSWSRNASFGSTTTSSAPPPPATSKTPSPPSRHAQPSTVLRSNNPRPNSPTREKLPPPSSRLRSDSDGRRDRNQRGPPPSYNPSVSTSPPRDTRDTRTSTKRRGDGGDDLDYSTDSGAPQAKPMLTVRNPSPLSEASTERAPSPPRGQPPRTTTPQPSQPKPPYHSSSSRRSTLPRDSRPGLNGQPSMNGHRTAQLHSLLEQPQRRLSGGDPNDQPSFSFDPLTHPGRGINAPLARCVRWDENLICPSPVFPNRRKGWFNRRGDQLWTNEGGYKPPPLGDEYPPDLDDYPEYGEGWMNEECVRIDMTHHLIPKLPRRSALKQPKPLC